MIFKKLQSGVLAASAFSLLVLGGLVVGALGGQATAALEEIVLKAGLRKPIALAQSKDARCLFVANQRSGSVSVIDLAAMRVKDEFAVGRKLADLAMTADDVGLVAIDEEAGELILLDREGPKLAPRSRLKVSPSPVSLQL